MRAIGLVDIVSDTLDIGVNSEYLDGVVKNHLTVYCRIPEKSADIHSFNIGSKSVFKFILLCCP